MALVVRLNRSPLGLVPVSMAPRIYIARLAGLYVFDPNGDQVGRVRDAVARPRTGGLAPRVVGLVAEIAMRRRIFLPIGRVTAFDTMRPADLANVLQDLSDARRVEVATALDDERLADVLEELPEHDQLEIIAALEPERAADVLEEMNPDDAADLLAELPKPEQEVLLDLMEPDEAS